MWFVYLLGCYVILCHIGAIYCLFFSEVTPDLGAGSLFFACMDACSSNDHSRSLGPPTSGKNIWSVCAPFWAVYGGKPNNEPTMKLGAVYCWAYHITASSGKQTWLAVGWKKH
jgi:hypothetical protein